MQSTHTYDEYYQRTSIIQSGVVPLLRYTLSSSMARIAESLKKLSVETVTQKHDSRKMKSKRELISSIEEGGNRGHYVLSVCGTQSDTDFRLGTALSNRTCEIYTVGESFSRTASLTHNHAPIVGIKFSSSSKNIVYTATSTGIITACDLRAKGKVVAEFKDGTEDGKLKPISSFDISCDDRLLAGGTEHIGGDTFILFWDIRHSNAKANNKKNFLGGYWQSHTEDVTCLSFHPSKKDILTSGSTDGLINVFDLVQSTEDAALTHSLNTESSVDRLGWLQDDNLWCTTHMHSLQLWACEDATPYANFERSNLAISQNDDPDNCYTVKYHTSKVLDQSFLLAGSSNVKGEHLRCLNIENDRLEMCYNMVGNKQFVRDSWLHDKSGCLVTVGESGLINIWRQGETLAASQNAEHKLVSKISTGKGRDRQHRAKPY